MSKKIVVQDEDGKDIDLSAELKEIATEVVAALEVPTKESVKSMFPVQKNESEMKSDAISRAANFIKAVVVGAERYKQFGIDEKAIDTTNGSMGYTVPTELANEIVLKKQKFSVIRGRAFEFDLSGPFDVPVEGTGVTGYWVAENAAITEAAPTTTKVSLGDYYLASLVKVSWKLLQTSHANIVSFVSTLAAKALAETEETAFVAGDGSSKPTGLRQASITGIAQGAAAIAYTDVTALYFGLPKKYRKNAVFITSNKGARLIHELKDTTNKPIFQPGMPLERLFEKDLLESEDIPENLGGGTNETEIFFGDLYYYWIKNGQAMEMATQDAIENLQTKIVVYEAVDGKVVLPDAFRKLTAVK